MEVKEGLKCGVKYQADIIRIGYRAYEYSKEEIGGELSGCGHQTGKRRTENDC